MLRKAKKEFPFCYHHAIQTEEDPQNLWGYMTHSLGRIVKNCLHPGGPGNAVGMHDQLQPISPK